MCLHSDYPTNSENKAVVVFVGKPYPFEVCRVDGQDTLFNDELEAQGREPSLYFAVNVALCDTKEVKVFEMPYPTFRDVIRVRDEYEFDRWAFEVRRDGITQAGEKTYSVLPERKLSPKEQAEFGALKPHDLHKLYGGNSDE